MPAVSLFVLGNGGFMRSNRINSPDDEKTPSQRPDINSAPKTYPLREQIFFGMKLSAVGGIIFLMLWVFEKM